MNGYVLALDQGTTSSRAVLCDASGELRTVAQYPLRQIYPRPGWVEHDPMDILDTILHAMAEAFEKSKLSPTDIAAIGITNQRETTILWDRKTGQPVCNAIVWQCRRTAELCEQLKAEGLGDLIYQRTGLLIDPYFSGTKLRWMLDQSPDLRRRAQAGELLCGTVDSWLIWNLTGRQVHCTDYSNASRTMLFDIDRLCWDEEICKALDIPMSMLPQPVPSSQVYGTVAKGLPGLKALTGIPICGSAGDQQAALFGQGCFREGMAKNTYGTGCFTLMNTGRHSIRCDSGLLTSVAWSIGGEVTYALEGSAFNAGSAIQWLRDQCGVIATSHDVDILAESIPDNGGVYFVPAFTGLGAPYWDSYARGSFFGLTRGSGKAELSRAVLEGIAFEVADLVQTMNEAAPVSISELRVDGGACVSDFMMQFQADLLRLPVNRPENVESTALGAAFLAGLAAGVWTSTEDLEHIRRTQQVFQPVMAIQDRNRALQNWHTAVELSRLWGQRCQL